MNVPKLRFKEFTNDWKEYILNNQSDVRDGTHDSPKYIDYGFPLITSKNLKDNGTLDLENVNYLNKEDFDKINLRSKVDIGDILFGMIGTIGKPVRVNRNDFAIKNVALIKEKGLIKNDYLIHYLQTTSIKKQFANNMDGGTQKFIALEKIRKLKISQPNRDEQLKLVNMFNLLDKKIELQSQKIEALKLYKKGLILREFSSSNLREISIKELGRVITGTTPSKDNNIYWENGNIAWITPTDITYYKDINSSSTLLTSEGLKKGRFIPKNSILITCIASIGKNAKLLVDGSCNQQINAIIPDKQYNSDYIYYLMEYMETYFKSIAGTTATSIINKETFENIKVKIHSFEKREFIGNFLNYFENKILLEDLKLENLRKIKKGFMQNMFV